MHKLTHFQTHLVGSLLLLSLLATTLTFGFRPVTNARAKLKNAIAERVRLKTDQPKLELENQELELSIVAEKEVLASKYHLPSDPDEPVLDLVSKMLQRHDLSLVSFREEVLATPGSIQAEIHCIGDYRSIAGLIHDLRILERPVRIGSFLINPHAVNGEDCLAQLKVEFSRIAGLNTLASKEKLK